MIISRCPFLSTRKKRERETFSLHPIRGPSSSSASLSLFSRAPTLFGQREREREKEKEKTILIRSTTQPPLTPTGPATTPGVCVYTHKEKVVATVGDPWRNDDVFCFVFKFTHTHVFFLLLLNGKVNLQTRPSFSKRNEKSFWHIYGFRLVHKCLIGFVQWRRSPAALLVIPSSPERRYDHVRVSFSLSLFIF